MPLEDLKLTLPYHLKSTKDVYLVVPDDAFYEAWRTNDPEQADSQKWRVQDIQKTKDNITNIKEHELPIPYIAIDAQGAQFINGRHRFRALHELGMEAIPCLLAGVDRNNLPSFIKPLSEEMRAKLTEGQNEGTGSARKHPFLSPEFLKEWAKDPAIAAALLRSFILRYGEEIGHWCLEHYQEHGCMPPREELNEKIEAYNKAQKEAFLRAKREATQATVPAKLQSIRLLEDLERHTIEIEIAAVQEAAARKGVVQDWTKHAEVVPQLLHIFEAHFGQEIAQPCLEYFQEHDEVPGKWNRQSMERDAALARPREFGSRRQTERGGDGRGM